LARSASRLLRAALLLAKTFGVGSAKRPRIAFESASTEGNEDNEEGLVSNVNKDLCFLRLLAKAFGATFCKKLSAMLVDRLLDFRAAMDSRKHWADEIPEPREIKK
jgi:hypothetical protein